MVPNPLREGEMLNVVEVRVGSHDVEEMTCQDMAPSQDED